VALVQALAPRRLDGPIHLAGNAVEELLNARGRPEPPRRPQGRKLSAPSNRV
jgi:hypothetical protein